MTFKISPLALLFFLFFIQISFAQSKKVLSINDYYKQSKNENLDLSERQVAINKAFKILANQKKDSIYYKIVYRKAVMHYLNNEYDSLIFYAKSIINLKNDNINEYYLGRANYLMGYYYHGVKFLPDSAFYYYNQSKSTFLKLKDSSEVGKRLLNMGYIQQDCNDYFGSKETITEALAYLSEKTDFNYVASAHNVLGTCNLMLLNNNDAIKHYKKAVQLVSLPLDKLIYKNNLANVYIEDESYNKAISILKSIISAPALETSAVQKARVIDNLAYAEWLKNQKNVSSNLHKALKIRKEHNDKLGLIASYTHLGEFYTEQDKTKAIKYFNNAIKTSKAIKSSIGELDAIRFLMDIKPNDLKLKTRYITLSDSLKRRELLVKTQFAKIQYDDKLNKEEIARLNTLASKQQLEVLAQKRQKIIYLLMAIIIIISIAYYIYFLIIKHKNDKEKQVLKAEQSISKRVHDEIANDISVLTNYVEENQKLPMDSSNHLLENKLQNLYLRARDISTETASIDLTDFKEELLNLILQYNTNHVNVITNLEDFGWESIPDYKKIVVYRVVQELFVNAKKHSKCKTITLIFNDKGKDRIITYKDDGIGFEKDGVKKNGLQNAINRIENINSTYIFETKPGSGFKATIVFKR